MEPINYGIEKTATPQGFAGGLQLGNAIYQMNQQRMLEQQQIEQQKQAQQAALLRQQQMNEVLNQHATKPTYETSVRIAAMYPKDQAEAISNATKTWSDEKKTNTAGQMIGIQTALTKNPEIGMKLLNDYYEALKNSGDEGQAQYIDMVRKTAEQNPNLASSMLIGPAASIVGVDKYSQFSKGLSESATEDQKRPYVVSQAESDSLIKKAEARNTPQALALKNRYTEKQIADMDSQIIDRANRFGLDQDKLRSDVEMKLYENNQKFGELPEGINKEITAATSESIAAGQAADGAMQLATEIENAAKEGMKSGVPATLAELWKKKYGSQDELTLLRKRFAGIATGAAMTAYKKYTSGQTSDKDVEVAMKPVPDDNADPQIMVQYLRGVSKLQRYEEVLGNAKSEWFGAVKGLGKAKTDLVIDGVRVPAGTSFKNFVDVYVPAKVKQSTAVNTQAGIPNRSYAVHANGAQ